MAGSNPPLFKRYSLILLIILVLVIYQFYNKNVPSDAKNSTDAQNVQEVGVEKRIVLKDNSGLEEKKKAPEQGEQRRLNSDEHPSSQFKVDEEEYSTSSKNENIEWRGGDVGGTGYREEEVEDILEEDNDREEHSKFSQTTASAPQEKRKSLRSGGRRLSGAVVRRNRGPIFSSVAINTDPAASETGAVNEFPIKYTGQARGYMILPLMHPRARESAIAQLENLILAGIEHIYLGVLTDGTFGRDFQFLEDVIRDLNAYGRTVHLALYISNGPTMRRWNTSKIQFPFAGIEPGRFRNLIRFDPEIRGRYEQLVRDVLPVFQLNKELGEKNVNYAIPMLEDNLNTESYYAMRGIVSAVLGDTAIIVRNPCVNCYRGNDGESFGDPIESHTIGEVAILSKGDGFVLDGTGYDYPWENTPAPDINEIRDLITLSNERGLAYFGLWRADRQGLYGGERALPSKRIYKIPTDAELRLDRQLLQLGLAKIGHNSN